MNIWTHIKSKLDIAYSTPQRIDQVELSELDSSREGRYYIIKNPEKFKYLKLSEKDYFIWSQLDGNTTVKDIVVKYFMQYGTFAFDRVGSLIAQLKENYFLKEQPVKIFQQIKEQIAKDSFEERFRKLRQIFFQKEIAISGIDSFLTFLYEKFFFLFFTKIAKVLYILLSVTGFLLFFRIVGSGKYQFFQTAGSYSLGILTLIIVDIISIGIHESAHAFTTKSYNRSVPRGGFLFYFGSPCFFVETSDIWMEPRGRRMMVSWAGPYSNIILASLVSLLMYLFPDATFNNLWYKVAFTNYLIGFLNLNPLLELDGYFILMDWLEIPLLRKKSLNFLRYDLLKKIVKRERFSGEEKIFTVFGVLAAIWTAFAIFISIYFLKYKTEKIFHEFLYGTDLGAKIFSAAILLLFIVPLVLSLAAIVYFGGKKIILFIIRLKFWKSIRNIFTLLLISALMLFGIPYIVPPLVVTRYSQIVYPLVLLIALYYSIKAFRDQAGSRFKGMRTFSCFIFLLLCSAMMGMSSVNPNKPGTEIQPALLFEAAAFVFLALFIYQIFAGFTVRLFTGAEKIFLLLSLPCTALMLFSMSLLPAEYALPHYFSVAVGILALFIFISSLFNYFKTNFLFSFIMIDAGVLALTLSIVFKHISLKVLAAAFITSGLLLYDIIHQRFYFTWHNVSEAEITDEQSRLYAAMQNFVENILLDFTEKYGSRNGKTLENTCNTVFHAAHPDITLTDRRLRIKAFKQTSIIRAGEMLQTTLNVIINQVRSVTGRPYLERMLVRAHDNLYWRERELAELHVFKGVRILQDYLPEPPSVRVDKQTLITSIPLFFEFSQEELDKLSRVFKIKTFATGETIIRQGERGETFYIIATGRVSVLQKDMSGVEREVATLSSGDYFGQVALIKNQPRNATVKAISDIELLVLHREDFNLTMKRYFEIQQKVNKNEEFNRFLEKTPLFSEFPKTQINVIACRMRLLTCKAGDQIIRQGEIGDIFYIIKQGKFIVEVQDKNGETNILAHLGPGEYFGEIALLIDVPRTASVKALTDGELFTLRKDDFNKMLGNSLYTQKNLELASSRRMYDIRRVS